LGEENDIWAVEPAKVGLADSLGWLSQLDQLSQMQEWTSLLHSSRRADKKTYMPHLESG